MLLACSWGGSRYPWISPEVLGVGIVGVLAFVAFLRIAGRAPEPLLPLSLFRGRVFSVSSMASVTFGAMMFAVTIYVPVYVQGAQGRSATASGFALIPLLLTWTVMSFVCGQIISRTGRYRAFPIVGSLFVILGAVLLLAARRRLLRRRRRHRRRGGRHRDGDDGADVHHRHAERRDTSVVGHRDRRAAVLPLDGRQPRRRRAWARCWPRACRPS